MPFMQCVTEESDEQKPFVLDLNGGLILETVNKYCLLHYSGKIFRIFPLAISKRTSLLNFSKPPCFLYQYILYMSSSPTHVSKLTFGNQLYLTT